MIEDCSLTSTFHFRSLIIPNISFQVVECLKTGNWFRQFNQLDEKLTKTAWSPIYNWIQLCTLYNWWCQYGKLDWIIHTNEHDSQIILCILPISLTFNNFTQWFRIIEIPSFVHSFIYIVNSPLFLLTCVCLNLRKKFRQRYLGMLKPKCSSVHDSESIQMPFLKGYLHSLYVQFY